MSVSLSPVCEWIGEFLCPFRSLMNSAVLTLAPLSYTFHNFGCLQTCRSTLLPPSQRVRTCCREMECLTTSKASTSSITSGGSDMTGPFTRELKTRRMSSRYGGRKRRWLGRGEFRQPLIHETQPVDTPYMQQGHCHVDVSLHLLNRNLLHRKCWFCVRYAFSKRSLWLHNVTLWNI